MDCAIQICNLDCEIHQILDLRLTSQNVLFLLIPSLHKQYVSSPFLPPTSDSKPESLEAHKIKTAFFTHPTLTEIGRRLVSHYLLLTEEELAMWEEDPESFGNSISPDWLAASKCYLDLQTGRAKRHVHTESRAARVCQVLHFRNLAMPFWLQRLLHKLVNWSVTLSWLPQLN